MHNLLIITPHFPSPDYYSDLARDPRTKFLYDYAESWVRQGCRVQVVHLPPRYPAVFNTLAQMTGKWPWLRSLRLNRFAQDPLAIRESVYTSAGIRIIRMPVPKRRPHREYSERMLRLLSQRLLAAGTFSDLTADAILADYLSPSLTVAIKLGRTLKATVFPIVHQTDLSYFRREPARYRPYLRSCGAILFRSSGMAQRFEQAGLTGVPREFLFSGIPDSVAYGFPRKQISRLLYVGTLRRSKNVHLILHALAALQPQYPSVEMELVGAGEYDAELKALAQKIGISDRVRFIGQLSRDAVFERMRCADALVMVSKETFGMVYVEAMSQGCLVVAARGEGIDGIVRDGENGLLVTLDDQQALTATLHSLLSLPPASVERISTQALQTAAGMRTDTLARDLLTKLSVYRGTARES